MNILFVSPGYPQDMPSFVRGLAAMGARVFGVGDQPAGALPPAARHALHDYVQVPHLWDETAMIETARAFADRRGLDRIECLWEPGVVLVAKLREALDLPGMRVEQALCFRDKERMKQRLDAAGVRTPRHARTTSDAEVLKAAERIGYPLIVKPVAGAGSADTYRVDGPAELQQTLSKVHHVPELSVEEFIEGEEFTFDTICAGGEIQFFGVCWYRPQPLLARTLQWVSPQTVALRVPEAGPLEVGVEMGRAVLRALEFNTGFTHMEWFRTPDGEAVFGEIAARAPGALSVDVTNAAADLDTFSGWAEAVCTGRFEVPKQRPYNAAVIFKRAVGSGRISTIEGLERLVARYRPHIVRIDLLPPGSPRRDWRRTLLSDGHVIVRHPDLQATLEMADRFGTDLRITAG